MKLNNTIKLFTLICVYLFFFSFKHASAQILYDGKSTIISSYFVGSAFLQNDSFNDDIFTSLEANLFARKTISDDFYLKFYTSVSYLSNREHDDSYSPLNELYVGIDSNYGNVYVGNTPTVYYNGFPAGWLDYKLINSQYDAIDPSAYGSFLITKGASRSIFYSYKFSNFKIALQGSAKDSDVINLDTQQNMKLIRKHGYGAGVGYAYGPIQFGSSYLSATFSDFKEMHDDFAMSISSIGAKIDVFGLYSAVGLFYYDNKWDIRNEAYSFQYLIKYDKYRIFNKRIVPQISYSYKHYTRINEVHNTNIIANNDLYASVSYFLSNNFEVFVEGKLDMRNSFQVEQINNIIKGDKYLRYNRVGLGIKGAF